ncbi:MAG: hypothetical protein PHH77_03910, partial [Victivallaceae bacterium]|nr:hypothetical protein [Victivallaceae bacterium]
VTRTSSGKAEIQGEDSRIAVLLKNFSNKLPAKSGIFRSRRHKSDRLLACFAAGQPWQGVLFFTLRKSFFLDHLTCDPL